MPRGAKNGEYRCVKFKVCLTESEAIEIAREAEEAGVRHKGQKIVCQKEHGFAHEKQYNTQGLAKFLRTLCFQAWKEDKAEREELREKARKVGLKIE